MLTEINVTLVREDYVGREKAGNSVWGQMLPTPSISPVTCEKIIVCSFPPLLRSGNAQAFGDRCDSLSQPIFLLLSLAWLPGNSGPPS